MTRNVEALVRKKMEACIRFGQLGPNKSLCRYKKFGNRVQSIGKKEDMKTIWLPM